MRGRVTNIIYPNAEWISENPKAQPWQRAIANLLLSIRRDGSERRNTRKPLAARNNKLPTYTPR